MLSLTALQFGMPLVRVQASQLMIPDRGVQWGSGLLRPVSRRCSTRVLGAHFGGKGMKPQFEPF